MTSTFEQIAQIAQTPEFQQRVNYSLIAAAVNVYSELPSVTGHAARSAYAIRLLNSPGSPFGDKTLQTICLAVLANSTIAAEAVPTSVSVPTGNGIPDTDIQFAINSLWNALAGV